MKTKYTDEYFLNLTMDYDERDDSIYPLWAVWCAKSEDKYYIDGKDHHFYTHVRTEQEIAIERKKREILEMMHTTDIEDTKEGHELLMQYHNYLMDLCRDDETILEVTPKTFEEWKSERN